MRNETPALGEDFDVDSLRRFVCTEAFRIEQPSALRAKAEQFLRDRSALLPAPSTLSRLIGAEREQARKTIFVHRTTGQTDTRGISEYGSVVPAHRHRRKGHGSGICSAPATPGGTRLDDATFPSSTSLETTAGMAPIRDAPPHRQLAVPGSDKGQIMAVSQYATRLKDACVTCEFSARC